ILTSAIALRGDRTAVRQKALGLWQSTSWTAMGVIVRELALGLAALGLEPGHVVSILSNTRQ
ncbi:long-chain fatty acid--CoA ligase, partial [Klebsiella pneumoniae]|uniref:long-chain fatty acid--CoA ligase n=1 Tax=Klebsiella pneumoniae TaxID=573 RepID=UPI0013D14668